MDTNQPPLQWLLCGLLALVVLFTVAFPVTNTDIWWHLAAGRLICETGSFLHGDPFALDTLGAEWIDLQWLFQLLAYGVHEAGGVFGLVIGKSLLVAGAALVLWLAARREIGPSFRPLGLVAIAVPIYLARYLILVRPVVLTLLYLSLFIMLLERFRRSGRWRDLLWLIPVQVLWVNSQGLFPLGPAVLLCYLFGEGLSRLLNRFAGFGSPLAPRSLARLALMVPALLVSCLLTPYGWRGLALPLRLLSGIDPVGSDLFAYNVSENIPSWVLERGATGIAGVGHFKWIAAAAFASFLLQLRRGPVVLGRLLTLVALFTLALMANRNILLFHWVAGFVLAVNLFGAAGRERAPIWPYAAAALALVGLAYLRVGSSQAEGPVDQISPFRVPTQAVRQLGVHGLAPGPALFNSVRYGGFITWELFPRWRPAIDGRLVTLRTGRQLAEHLDLADSPERTFARFARRHRIRVALLPAAFPERYLPLVRYLYLDPDWQLVYTDGTETLFVRDPAPSVPRMDLGSRAAVSRILTEIETRYRPLNVMVHERAILHLGRLLAEVGETGAAIWVLEHQPGHAARSLLARTYYLEGRTREARQLAERLLAHQPRETGTLNLLALIVVDQGHYRQAMTYLRRSLRLDPHNVEARRILERIRREHGADP